MEHNLNNQLAYRFTTQINDLGKINIPKIMRNLYSKEVEVILFIPEKEEKIDSTLNFYKLINQYSSIEEPELNINTILNDRKQQNTRKFIFD